MVKSIIEEREKVIKEIERPLQERATLQRHLEELGNDLLDALKKERQVALLEDMLAVRERQPENPHCRRPWGAGEGRAEPSALEMVEETLGEDEGVGPRANLLPVAQATSWGSSLSGIKGPPNCN